MGGGEFEQRNPMRQINLNLYPPDGYVFKESDGSVHRSDSWKNLAERVKDYRARSGLVIGNPMEDIMNQTCAKTPSFCREEVPFVLQHNPTGMSGNQRVLAWLMAMMGYARLKAIRRTDPAEASRRAAICARCPMQQPLNSACGACITMVERGRVAILYGDKPGHQNLHSCGVLGEDTVVSVEIDQEPADNPALPAHCWRKK